jgi:hypothetical protein
MRRLLLLTLLLFLAPTVALAAFVQGNVNTTGSLVTSITCATGTVTLGNVEIVGAKSNSQAFTSISSARVTTWTNLTNAPGLGYWYGIVTSSGAETVTVNLVGSDLVGIGCTEYSTRTTKDASASSSSTGSLNITTTKANSTLICLVGDGTTTAFSGGAGFTLRETAILQTGPNGHLIFGDVDEAATGTYACASSSGTSAITVANFYAAASAVVPRHR